MILYFSGTGNSFAIARKIAEATNDQLLPLIEAVQRDLTNEKRIGLVFPTYDFNLPPIVRASVSQLNIGPKSYVFAVITCGGQTGNCVWALRRLLRKRGVELAYTHKVSVPDNSALAFGRNPNNQMSKFDRVPERMEQIISDIQAQHHELHYAWWSFLSWIMGLPTMEKGMIRTLRPKVNPDKCIGCDTCVRICPMENIRLTDKKALIGDNCTVCLACVHACQQQAIGTNGREALKERQYRHPDIKLKDLIKR